MPSFISKLGVWEPKEEYHINPTAKPGENPVYQGPDRAALEMMKEQGVDSFGTLYSTDSELAMLARALGFKDLDEYLKVRGWNKEKALANYEAEKKKVVTHELPDRKNPGKFVGGGQDYSMQGNDRSGGIGKLPPDVPAAFTRPE